MQFSMKFSIVESNICRPCNKKDRNDKENRTITEKDRYKQSDEIQFFLYFFFLSMSAI